MSYNWVVKIPVLYFLCESEIINSFQNRKNVRPSYEMSHEAVTVVCTCRGSSLSEIIVTVNRYGVDEKC